LPALAAILLVFFMLLAGALRLAVKDGGREDYLDGLALAATLAATAVVACFDAVLLLPASSFMVWALFGALAAPSPALRSVALTPRLRRRLLAAVALVGTAALLRSSGQVAAMALYGRAHTAAQFRHAALLDPGSARIRSRLAAIQSRRNARPTLPEPAPAAGGAGPAAPASLSEGGETAGDPIPGAAERH
jgi:hypothetical protein